MTADRLLSLLRDMDAKATKGPWTMAYGGGIEIDRFGRERPNPKPFVAVAHAAPPDGIEIARGFERAYRHDAKVLVALRSGLPELIAVLKAADATAALMVRPAHIFSCGAYSNNLTGKCTCGVDAAYNAYDAARAAWLAKIEGGKDGR